MIDVPLWEELYRRLKWKGRAGEWYKRGDFRNYQLWRMKEPKIHLQYFLNHFNSKMRFSANYLVTSSVLKTVGWADRECLGYNVRFGTSLNHNLVQRTFITTKVTTICYKTLTTYSKCRVKTPFQVMVSSRVNCTLNPCLDFITRCGSRETYDPHLLDWLRLYVNSP